MSAALCVLIVVAASCSGDEPADDGSREPEALRGRILATGFSGGENVQMYDPSTSRTTELPMPQGVEVVDAFWGPDGHTAYALATSFTSLGTPTAAGRARLYEAVPGADARPVGRRLLSEGEELSVSGSKVLVSECDGPESSLLLLDLEGARRWREVAPGCSGALSADGATVLFTRGKRLWKKPIEGGPAEEVAALDTVGEDGETIRTEGIAGLRYAGSAIVATVVIDGRYHPAVGRPGERFRLIRMQDYPSFIGVAPQPGGSLIGMTQAFGNSRTSALIRMYDVDSRRLEVVGAGGGGYFEPAWAPSGDVMVASNLAGNWVFIDETGDWVDVRKVTGLIAQDWSE
jgi:hypothetical protein